MVKSVKNKYKWTKLGYIWPEGWLKVSKIDRNEQNLGLYDPKGD